MSAGAVDEAIAAMSGAAALPRRNGELVFAAPWQSRAFGIAVDLCNRGLYAWREFQSELIAVIAAWPAEGAPADAADVYYRQWLTALERLSIAKGLVTPEDLERRRREESGTP